MATDLIAQAKAMVDQTSKEGSKPFAGSSFDNGGVKSTGDTNYTVQKGDTLSGISKNLNTPMDQVISANGITNPNMIYPGQTIKTTGSTYTPAPVNTNTSSSNGTYINSSDTQRAADGQVKTDITNLTTGGDALGEATKKVYESGQTTIDNYIKGLQTTGDAQINDINNNFNNLKTTTEAGQKKDLGTSTMNLARIGGFLGESASSTQYLRSVNEANRVELVDLEAKRVKAINEARSAMNDKNFAAAKEKISLAKEYANEINDRYNKHFDQVRNITNDALAREKTQLDITDTKSKSIAPAVFAELTGDPTHDNELISRVALSQGISPAALAGAVTTLRQDTQVVEAGGRKLLVNSRDGRAIKDLGPATVQTEKVTVDGKVKLIDSQTGRTIAELGKAGTGNGTAGERTSAAVSKYSNVFVPGATLKDKTPVIDANGFITPKAWKEAISSAPSEGLDRKQFIQEFGYLLFSDNGEVDKKYGLTPSELKLING